MSKRRHNFGTKRFKEKSLFIFHARIALKSLILLFVRLIARGARIGKTHTHTHRQTDRTSTVTLAHARRGLMTKPSSESGSTTELSQHPSLRELDFDDSNSGESDIHQSTVTSLMSMMAKLMISVLVRSLK